MGNEYLVLSTDLAVWAQKHNNILEASISGAVDD